MRKTNLGTGWQLAAGQWQGEGTVPKKLGFSQLEWLPAQVPGQVHLDLVRHRVIADPFEGYGELGAQWVDEESWTYRTTFQFSPDPERPRCVLRFEGLDTVCRILLNGEVIATNDNMFVAVEVDVAAQLVEGANDLRVEFSSAAQLGRVRREVFLKQEGLPDNVARLPERAFLRKAQYMFAWDWGPRLVSAGIWKPVSLLQFASRLTDVHVSQQHGEDGSVRLTFASEFEGSGQVVHWLEGHSEPIADGESVTIENPRLWWPRGMGDQARYEVVSCLIAAGSDPKSSRASCVDRRSIQIGLRTLTLLQNEDAQGESFEFEVNGKRLWAVGANWIPDHSLPAAVDRRQVERQVRRAADMNMNMLRIWGGGLYESDEFYDVCDAEGMLVWQDFPFACCYVPDGEREQAVLRQEAAENIRRVRNHPSLALWCGNNENLTMWHSKWETPLPQPTRYYGEHLYDRTLPEVVRQFDPSRPYVASSPIGGENANDGDVGDQHYWDVWHGRGDWKHYKDSTGRFASEFGFASAPGRTVWRKIFCGDPQWGARDVRDRLARWHDKTGKGYDTYVGYCELHYPAAENIEQFLYTSQLNQRDALRFGIEHYRRSVGCRGALIWQLNDCWPVQSWAVLDSDGAYKAAAFELRRLYADALVSIEHEPGQTRADLWVMLDNASAPVDSPLTAQALRASDGRVLQTWTQPVCVSNDERRIALELDLSGLVPEETLLLVQWAGTKTFRCLAEPKEMKLSQPRLAVEPHPEGLVVRSDVPVVDLMLWDPSDEVEFFDNFVTLPAGGQTVIRASGRWRRLRARSLAGVHSLDC